MLWLGLDTCYLGLYCRKGLCSLRFSFCIGSLFALGLCGCGRGSNISASEASGALILGISTELRIIYLLDWLSMNDYMALIVWSGL